VFSGNRPRLTLTLYFCLGIICTISVASKKIFTSPPQEVKKGAPSLTINIKDYVKDCVYLEGDVKVEVFSKSKITRKVRHSFSAKQIFLLKLPRRGDHNELLFAEAHSTVFRFETLLLYCWLRETVWWLSFYKGCVLCEFSALKKISFVMYKSFFKSNVR